MNNYKFYGYTTIGFSLLFILLTMIATPLLLKNSAIALLDSEINSGRKEAHQIAVITTKALSNKMEKNVLVDGIQDAIDNSENETIFVSVFDWSGKIICHPDRTQIRQLTSQSSTVMSNIESVTTGSELYNFIKHQDIQNSDYKKAEVIYLEPIPSSDWIIASHINTDNIRKSISTLRNQMLLIFAILGLTSLLFVLGVVRFVSSFYSKQLAIKTVKLEDGVLNLSKLNDSLDNYQESLIAIQMERIAVKETETIADSKSTDITKQRLLTYVRNELKPIATEEIAYIYVDNTITYIIDQDGKRSTTNDSLDQVFSTLDDRLFFRANRQIIVAIHAIDKITKYGNSALKIQTSPLSEVDIVIGKNKAASFKQWLDQ